MRQQLECEVARPGYETAAVRGSALGDRYVTGTSPVSDYDDRTVCVTHSAREGGGGHTVLFV